MARPKKVIRTKTLYKKKRLPKKAGSRILFILLIVILVGIGFIVMREWSARFGPNADKIKPPTTDTSSVQEASKPESSEPQSSEPQKIPTAALGKTARLSAARLLELQANVAAELASFKEQGYTSVLVELKAENGMLCYQSANGMAVRYGTVSENAIDLAALKKAITDAGLRPIAAISTLKDPKAAHVSNENSYAYDTSLNVNWLDNSMAKGGKAWLNPYMENTRAYLCDLSKEISEAGFETILLENIMFPDKNTFKMNTILTTPDRPVILNQLVSEIQAAVGDKVNIIRGVDAAAVAVGEVPFSAAILTLPEKQLGLLLDLSKIEANKQKICTQNGIVDQNDYDKNMTAATVAVHLIEQAAQNGENKVIPIIASGDFAEYEPLFQEKGITDYIVK